MDISSSTVQGVFTWPLQERRGGERRGERRRGRRGEEKGGRGGEERGREGGERGEMGEVKGRVKGGERVGGGGCGLDLTPQYCNISEEGAPK